MPTLNRSSIFLGSAHSSNGVHAIPARVIATLFMLACFAGTVFFGLFNGNGWPSILGSALGVAAIAWIAGMMIGSILLRSVNDHIDRHRVEHPIPEESNPSGTQPHAVETREVGRTAVG